MSDDIDQRLLWTVKNGDLGELKSLVEVESADVNKEIQGRVPLHYAADYGHSEVIDYLLSKGAKVNVADKYGITALLAAIYESHPSCVKLLLEKGADKSGKSPDGNSYIDCAETEEIKALLK